MTEIDVQEHIKKSLINIKQESPIILIAGARKWFFERKKDGITQLSSIDSVNKFIEDHSNKTYKTPLVLDIMFSSFQAENGLLKFIEESKTPIVVLSDYDTLSPIMMSRFKAVYKYPTKRPTNQFLSVKQAQEEIEERKLSYLSEDEMISTLSPKLFKVKEMTPNKRIQELLGDYYDRFNR